MIPSDNVTKSMLSFGADVVKSKTNIWEHLGISVSGLWSTAWKAENQHLLPMGSQVRPHEDQNGAKVSQQLTLTTWMPQLRVKSALLPYLSSHVCAKRPLF